MKLGLWKLRYYSEWLPRDGLHLGYAMAYRKHRNLLTSWNAPLLMQPAPERTYDSQYEIHLLTGEFHFHLSCFCLFSLSLHADFGFVPVVHEDGTLKEEQRREMSRIFPNARFISNRDADAKLDAHLPRNRYPALHRMRDRLHLMKKLMDVHAGGMEPRLFIDSDVLFYRNPSYLASWLRTGSAPIYMLDYQDSYGADAVRLESILGRPMPDRVNTGLCGFYSPSIDWDRAEHLAERLITECGITHFSEQALTAMLLSDSKAESAPPDDYVVSPSTAETANPQAVMHHYVVPSRTWYYTCALPAFLKPLNAWP